MSDGTSPPSLWLPETDQVRLATLGKLGEECGELAAIIFRCVIQGIDEREPVTGKSNREALREEMADVMAMLELVIEEEFKDGDNEGPFTSRIDRKLAMKQEWLRMIREHLAQQTTGGVS